MGLDAVLSVGSNKPQMLNVLIRCDAGLNRRTKYRSGLEAVIRGSAARRDGLNDRCANQADNEPELDSGGKSPNAAIFQCN